MTGVTIMNTLNRYFMLNDIGLRARWRLFLSDEEMMKQIRHLIRKNKPVVLSIGPNIQMYLEIKESICMWKRMGGCLLP